MVELELDKEVELPSQEDEQEGMTEEGEAPKERPMETSEEESGESPRRNNTRSTLTTKEDSEQETSEPKQAPAAKLRPIPPLLSLVNQPQIPSPAHISTRIIHWA